MRRHGVPGHSTLTGAGAPRHQQVVDARIQRNGLAAALKCKKCGEIVFTQKLKDAVAAPRTHQALARQASERHERVCAKREEAVDGRASD